MNRLARYADLVARRKAHTFPDGLLNPSQIEGGRHDSDQLGPWSRWQGSLHAEAVVVGQDWGDLPYFLRNGGLDSDHEQTCSNLRTLVTSACWEIGRPSSPVPQPLFFSNAVLGIRSGKGKSGAVPATWVDDSLPFLIELLDIIRPRAVVSLGNAALRACQLAIHGRQCSALGLPGLPLKHVHSLNPILSTAKPAWFAFYHCGPLGLANRTLDLQMDDWHRLGAWLRR